MPSTYPYHLFKQAMPMLLVCVLVPPSFVLAAQQDRQSDALALSVHNRAHIQTVGLHGFVFVNGLSTEHMATSLRRRHLPSQSQLECAALDSRLPTLKLQVRRAAPELKTQARQRLEQARARFAQLGC